LIVRYWYIPDVLPAVKEGPLAAQKRRQAVHEHA